MAEKIAILFPTATEAAPYIDKYGPRDVHICGIGLAECAAGTIRVILDTKPDFIILAGIAGAYADSGLVKGDTVTVLRENSADLGTMRNGVFVALAKDGGKTTDNHYINRTPLPGVFPQVISNSVNTAGTTSISGHASDTAIENMEGASFFAACCAFGIKYAELRCISNIVEEAPSEWNIPLAAGRLADSIAMFIEKLKQQ